MCGMVAAIALATFVIFVLVDFYLQRRRLLPSESATVVPKLDESPFPMTVVAGFALPAHLSYHLGHAWASKEAGNVVRVGLDDFAARLLGEVDRVELPARGRWLRQGEKAWTLVRGTHRFDMLSPIEGEVIDVNTEALKDPGVPNKDPYGAGWLVAVHAPAVDANLKNLLRGRLAQRWMEDSVAALSGRTGPATAIRKVGEAQAGRDLIGRVPEEGWDKLVSDLLPT